MDTADSSLPQSITALLCNTYIASTASFLNSLCIAVEERLLKVSSQITRLEKSVALLETRLSSVPDLPMEDMSPPPGADAVGT